MSELKNNLMGKIENKEVKMRSRSFFVFVKALMEVILVALFVCAIYLINLSFYLPKRDFGPIGRGSGLRPELFFNTVPWHYLVLGALGLGVAFWIMYRFTGTYKKHFAVVVTLISVAVLVFSAFMAFSNFNERVENRPHLRGIYRMDQSRPGPRDGSGPGMRGLK